MSAFDLDLDLVNHLGVIESVNTLRAEGFSPRLIEDDAVKEIFEWAMGHVRDHKRPAAKAVIEKEFNISLGEPVAAVGDLIDRFRSRYVRNRGEEIVENVGKTVLNNPLDVGKTLLHEGKKINELVYARGESWDGETHIPAMAHYDRRVLQGIGPSLGFEAVDLHFHGQSGLTFLVASPKSYKSWIAIQAALTNAENGGYSYFYSLELPAIDTLWRMKCLKANIPYWKYLQGALSHEDRAHLEKSAADLDQLQYRIEKPKIGERSVPQLIERAINMGANAIFVDQLQYVEASNGHSLGGLNETGWYFESCNQLKDYTDEVPIFVVHQFNRSTMGATSMPDPQQAKGSAAIEETATLQLGLYTNKDMRQSKIVQYGVLASRHYDFKTWEVGVELTKGCSFSLIGEAE